MDTQNYQQMMLLEQELEPPQRLLIFAMTSISIMVITSDLKKLLPIQPLLQPMATAQKPLTATFMMLQMLKKLLIDIFPKEPIPIRYLIASLFQLQILKLTILTEMPF